MNLENVLSEIEEQESLDFQEVFAVVDLETAAEAQRRIAWYEEKKKEADTIIEQQIAPFLARIEKIKEWGRQSKDGFEERQAYYSNLLEQFMKAEIEKQIELGKKPKKSLSLPYGKISLKKQQPEFLRDEATLLEYAKEIGFVKVKETADWAAIKKSCAVVDGKLWDMNGEAVPGVTVIEKEEKFEIKLDC